MRWRLVARRKVGLLLTASQFRDWLRGVSIAEVRHGDGHTVIKAASLAAIYGACNELRLAYDKETREWVNRHFSRETDEPLS